MFIISISTISMKLSQNFAIVLSDSSITQFFVHIILRIIENPLTRAFTDDCQLHQLRRPGDAYVVWDAVQDGDDEASPPSSACLPSLSS